jgi:hypothetical protein
MSDLKSQISFFLDTLIKELTDNYVKTGRKASGKWPSGLEKKITENNNSINAKLLGYRYTGALINGRKPNTKQDDDSIKRFVGWAGSTFLKEWVEDKKVNASPYAIAYKIAREGIKIPNEYNKGDLLSNVITEKKIDDFADSLGKIFIKKVNSDVMKEFEK